MSLSPAQQTYFQLLDTLEAERNDALQKQGTDPERLNITMLRRMSAALVKLRAAQLEAVR